MDIDYLIGTKKGKPKGLKMMDINSILPKIDLKKTTKDLKELKPKQIEIHHYYHNMPNESNMSSLMQQQRPVKKFRLTALEGELMKDSDGDGIPNGLDSHPFNPNLPKKKMIYEKALQSIYRSEKD